MVVSLLTSLAQIPLRYMPFGDSITAYGVGLPGWEKS